ncbi:MAG: NAD-dependent epimerase/dehydratase family protein [Ilumatobacteraceae bacterium]
MKVAVQGASGFVGSRLIERLHLGGMADVVPIVRTHGSLSRIARFDLDWRLADGLDGDALTEAFKGCDVAFLSVAGPEPFILGSPAATIRAARRAGVSRVVYLSTAVTLGFNPGPGTDDDTPPVTDQPWTYNRAKARAENLIDDLRHETGVEVVVLRPSIVYGPRSLSWTTALAQRLLWRTAFVVDGGANVCNAVYVDNLVDAMWLAATVPGAANQQFFVADRERVTWADMYRPIAEAVGVPTSEIHSIDRAEVGTLLTPPSGVSARISRQVRSERARRLASKLPDEAMQRFRRLRGAWRPAADGVRPGARDFLSTVPDVELLVQICDTQLPIAKAERILGYQPIPFAEGARRSAAWVTSMGFVADVFAPG